MSERSTCTIAYEAVLPEELVSRYSVPNFPHAGLHRQNFTSSMKRYFKGVSESDYGEGFIWMEFDGETPTRQVERYGDWWFSSRRDDPVLGMTLGDRRLSQLDFSCAEEIESSEFEAAWRTSGISE
jgi:hypothetical protein